MADTKSSKVGTQRSDDGKFVHIGVIDGNAFIPFASLRSGDYDEAVAAAAETKPSASEEE